MLEKDVLEFLRTKGFAIYDKPFDTVSNEIGSPPFAVMISGERYLRSCNYKTLDGQEEVKVVTVKDDKEDKVIGLCYNGDFCRV